MSSTFLQRWRVPLWCSPPYSLLRPPADPPDPRPGSRLPLRGERTDVRLHGPRASARITSHARGRRGTPPAPSRVGTAHRFIETVGDAHPTRFGSANTSQRRYAARDAPSAHQHERGEERSPIDQLHNELARISHPSVPANLKTHPPHHHCQPPPQIPQPSYPQLPHGLRIRCTQLRAP